MSDAFLLHAGHVVPMEIERIPAYQSDMTERLAISVDLTSPSLEGLGLGYYMTTEVGAVMPGMPAADIGLQPGECDHIGQWGPRDDVVGDEPRDFCQTRRGNPIDMAAQQRRNDRADYSRFARVQRRNPGAHWH